MLSPSDRLPIASLDADLRESAREQDILERLRRLRTLEQRLRRLGRSSVPEDAAQVGRIVERVAERPLPAVGRAGFTTGTLAVLASAALLVAPIAWFAAIGHAGFLPLAVMLVATVPIVLRATRAPAQGVAGIVICAVIAVLGGATATTAIAVRPLFGLVIDVVAVATVVTALVAGLLVVRAWAAAGWQPAPRLLHPAESALTWAHLIALALVVLDAPTAASPW